MYKPPFVRERHTHTHDSMKSAVETITMLEKNPAHGISKVKETV
jgi:hypothetical protein